MVKEDTGAMVTDVLDEPEPMPLRGGILRRRFAGKTSSRLFADWSLRTKKLSPKIVVQSRLCRRCCWARPEVLDTLFVCS